MTTVWRCARALAALLCAGVAHAAEPLRWFDGPRIPARAQVAIELLEGAAEHGLPPSDYAADVLRGRVDRAGRVAIGSGEAAVLDALLTAAVERYLSDLHRGRIDPAQLPRGYAPARPPFDPRALLDAALAQGDPAAAVRRAAPSNAQYERLRAALSVYRGLSGHPAWRTELPPLPAAARGAPKLEPGQEYAGVALLHARLSALGDLDATMPIAHAYEGAMVDAVRAFQRRHGLADDGVIGKATYAQLQVTPEARAGQIALSLERLRWTPLADAPRMVVINVPEFTLRAYEVVDGAIVVRHTMRVIVGKALDTRTPLFAEQMRTVEFQPYWNVPPSIARGEVIPRLRRDPGYFDREGFEFVTPDGVVAALSDSLLDDVRAGRARIRQRPGPRNALGDIKFVFPNRDNVYLHHTPSVQLFARDRRDFSHGCIRVEAPVALAGFVLGADWGEDRIRQAMSGDPPRTVRLPAPVPVVITYGTAIFKEGKVHFFEDIYGHDRRLQAALSAPRPPLPGLQP